MDPVCVSVFFNATAPAEIDTLSLHDALPISFRPRSSDFGFPAIMCRSRCTHARAPMSPSIAALRCCARAGVTATRARSEEHTSELQSHSDLVCRLLLEKKKHSALGYVEYNDW